MTVFDFKVMLFAFVLSALVSVPAAWIFELDQTAAGLLGAFMGLAGIAVGAKVLD